MSGEKLNTYGTTMAREREAYCEAKQIRLAARNTNLWNDPLVRQVRTNEVSEHMLQKRPKGAPSDRREWRTLASLSKAKTA